MSGNESYSKVLNYSRKRTIESLEIIYLVVTVGFNLVITQSMVNSLGSKGELVGLPFYALYFEYFVIILLLLTFLDEFFKFGMFFSIKNRVVAILLLTGAVSTFLFSIGLQTNNTQNLELLSLLYFVNIMSTVIAAGYFLLNSQSKSETTHLISQFKDIKEELKRIPLSDLKIDELIQRAEKWLFSKQDTSGTWGEKNPLYETSEVGRLFVDLKKPLSYSWTQIVNGEQETRTFEQIYYLVLDVIEKIDIEPTYEKLIPLLFILNVDPKNAAFNDEQLAEITKLMFDFSEWDFVNEIQSKEFLASGKLPYIPVLGPIYKLLGQMEPAQLLADIIANTFNIVLNRSITRFNVTAQEENISNLFLGLLFNSLIEMTTDNEPIVEIKPSKDEGFAFDLPSFSDTELRIETRLEKVKEYIRNQQGIEGGWDNSVYATALCLRSVIHNDSVERDVVKYAVYFLGAQQESNGSWNNDIAITCEVLKTLHKINSQIFYTR